MKTAQPSNKVSSVPNDVKVRRIGLAYNPPTIILEYLVPSSGKLYHHKIKLKDFNVDTQIGSVLQYIQQRHGRYFQNQKFPEEQLKFFIEKLKHSLKYVQTGKNGFEVQQQEIEDFDYDQNDWDLEEEQDII